MNRKVAYRDGDVTRRIVSFPNGLWQAQIRIAERGTDQVSNWIGYHAPTSREVAMQQLSFRDIGETIRVGLIGEMIMAKLAE